MDNIREAAISFEAVKLGMTQDKNGVVLKLSIHPDEVPQELLRAWVGARFVIGMVQIGDDEQPVVSDEQRLANKSVAIASALCRNSDFQTFITQETAGAEGVIFLGNEEKTRDWLRGFLGLDSLALLKEDKDARESFFELREQFISWTRK